MSKGRLFLMYFVVFVPYPVFFIICIVHFAFSNKYKIEMEGSILFLLTVIGIGLIIAGVCYSIAFALQDGPLPTLFGPTVFPIIFAAYNIPLIKIEGTATITVMFFLTVTYFFLAYGIGFRLLKWSASRKARQSAGAGETGRPDKSGQDG